MTKLVYSDKLINMLEKISKSYNPEDFEDKIYKSWENSGLFNPDNLDLAESAPSYTIILPPPNITDKLHMGHSVMIAIEDLLIRYHRQKGYRALWLPGTDHAAIATQNAVEKKILKETGKTRHDLGKEEFLKEVWKFIDETQATILKQIKKMGASLDWSRLAFTLDEPRQKAVEKMFVDMYESGVIYRGERIVNWCPRCHSTLADDEVEYKEKTSELYTFYYSKDLPIAISTTRPETKLGDTAIAVNPKDKRYIKYLGKTINLSFLGVDLSLQVITDNLVDKSFGSGALGVTPAHSMADWQMAQEHNLEFKKVIDEDGLIKNDYAKYSKLSSLEARKKIVNDLKEAGLLIKTETIENNISTCYRCSSAIEPLLSKQWFVSVDKPIKHLEGKSLKQKAAEVVENEEIKFLPARFKQTYLNWVNNLHDWCISRQIWFGHRIPAWHREDEVYVGFEKPKEAGWQKDEDTLDTWFSSGMWTFSTLGWPDNYQNGEKKGDLAKFHPTNVLETGYDIITLWVSRMVMMSLFTLNEVPFKEVYLHGMILDGEGKKMSKSKGNGIDPMDLIEKYGADAVRLSLLTGVTPGNDSRYSEEKAEAKRNFINKFWNISRFIISFSDNKINKKAQLNTLADRWIFSKFLEIVENTNERLEKKDFSLATEELINFIWNDLANWYLEISKIEKNKEEILSCMLSGILRLIHPLAPFVSEAIWQSWQNTTLMTEKYPSISEFVNVENVDLKDFELIQEIIVAIREARSAHKIEPSKKIAAYIVVNKKEDLIKNQQALIKNLKTNIKELNFIEKKQAPKEAVFTIASDIEIYLLQEIDKDQELERLDKERKDLEKYIKIVKVKLDNSDFVKKAPEKVVKIEKEKLKSSTEKLEKIIEKIKNLK